MNQYDARLRQFIEDNGIAAEHLVFQQSCHSVADAALAANATAEDLVKNICMLDAQGNLIVAIVKGEHRASASRVAKALAIPRPRIAQVDEILVETGYPCGGAPSFGYPAVFLVDPKVMEKDRVYTGGGSPTSLVKIAPQELLRANRGRLVRIRS